MTLFVCRSTDNLHYEKFADGMVKCIEDEIPFEIPESWAWCRLGNISDNIQYGLSNSTEKVGTCRFLRITDIQNGGVDWDTVPFTNTNELDKYLLHINDILFARTGGTVGKSFLVSHLPFDSVFASYLIRVQLTNDISAQYIYWFFNSPTYWEQITCKTVGTGQPNCNGASLRNLLIPLPPLDEQYRILNKLAEIRPLIEDYSVTYNRIQDVHKGFPDKIKQSVLQWAVQGKLIQQDENDEPASMLLERIRAEKEELIKQGKIKRDKRESVIYQGADNSYYERFADGSEKCIDEEIPFEIPGSWLFVRLKEIGSIIGGGTPRTSNESYWDGNIYWITPADLSNHSDIYISHGSRSITELGLKDSSATLMPAHTVLYSSRAPIGHIAIAANALATNQGFKSVVPHDTRMSLFVYFCLKERTPSIVLRATGTTFKEISGTAMAETIVPLPPLREQKRICNKIRSLFTLLENMHQIID